MADMMARVSAKAALTFYTEISRSAYFHEGDKLAMTVAFIRSMSRG
jgi:hypothetical protein